MLKLGPELFELLNAKQRVGNQKPVIYGKGGLSILQVQLIEAQLGFPMPEDFAYLLQNVRDPGEVLFPWSNFKTQRYDDAIASILKGIEFDIEHNNLWLRRWAGRPVALSAALEIAREDFPRWPKLLPVYGHRFLAAEPCRRDNPVFSIRQTDMVCYGANLAHYLLNEFVKQDQTQHVFDQPVQTIEIWSDFAEGREEFLTKGLDPHKMDRLLESFRNAPRRNSTTAQTIPIELMADGNILMANELIGGHQALEDKLCQLMRLQLPLDVYILPNAEDVDTERLAAIYALLRTLDFVPIVLVERGQDKIKAFNGWRYG